MLSKTDFIRAAANQALQSGLKFDAAALVELTAGVAAADGQPAKLPTFKINAYSGVPMMVAMSYYPVVVDLSGLKAKQQIPILADHESGVSSIIGQSDKVEVTAEGVTISGQVMAEDATAQKVVGLAKNGFKWQASIGASVDRREMLDAGKTATVNGKQITGPMIIARQATLKEVSFVSIGADGNTSAAVAAKAGETDMNFEQWLKANGFDAATITEQQRKTLKASYDAEQLAAAGTGGTTQTAPAAPAVTAAAPAVDLQASIKEQNKLLAANTTRVNGINSIAAKYRGQIKAEDLDKWTTDAIAAGDTVDSFELKCLRAGRTAPSAGGGNSARQTLSAAVLTAALCASAGMGETAIAATIPQAEREQVMNQVVSANMRGYSLHALMDEVIRASGSHYSGSRKSNGFISAAFEAENNLRAAGFSSISLSGILSNVANKGLIAAYTAVEVVWNKFCAVRNHGDFKLHSRYRLDSTGAFKKVGPDGELKHAGLTDSTFTNQIGTFGTIIALTRQMIINDDLGAFMAIPDLLGRMAALRVEEAAFVLLLSNPSSFFGTGNANYMSGGTTNLTLDSLTTAEQKFRDMVDSNGKPVLVSPKTLLTGSALAVTAQKFYRDTTVIADGVTSTKSLITNQNPHAGKYPPISSPYINNTAIKDQDGAAITGQSSTAWFLFADPAVRAAIAVAFLNGQQTPTIENAQTDFNTLGMQWRAYHDFGVGMEDPKAAVMSAGA